MIVQVLENHSFETFHLQLRVGVAGNGNISLKNINKVNKQKISSTMSKSCKGKFAQKWCLPSLPSKVPSKAKTDIYGKQVNDVKQ